MGELMDDLARGRVGRVATEERAAALFNRQAEHDSQPWHYGTMAPATPDGFGVAGLPGSPESAALVVALRDCIAAGLAKPEAGRNLARWEDELPLIAFRAAWHQGRVTYATFWVYRPVATSDGKGVAGEHYSLSGKARRHGVLLESEIPISLAALVRSFCPGL